MMKYKLIQEESFTDYKEPSMVIACVSCNWKCALEGNFDPSFCHNSSLSNLPIKTISNEKLYQIYKKNNITKAIIFGGLEPFLQFKEILNFIKYLRRQECNDTVVIYTGYTETELYKAIQSLKQYSNIVLKFGRYIPNRPSVWDEVLGVELASDNQYGIKIS